VYNEIVLSHADLDARSNQVANYLVGAGVKPGDRVGLCLDRSIEMIVVLMGILKAGASYVPLDPAYPANRLSMMVEDAGVRCLFTHAGHAQLFSNALVWENISGQVERMPLNPVEVAIAPESVAYVIFTSGSTGRPKGIAMPHRALANLVEWQLKRKTFKMAARMLQYTSISFDVSFQEIATTIASGGTLHLISNDDRKDPRKLLVQLIEHKIERLFLPYVAMRSIIEAALMTGTYPQQLKEIITAGEQLRVDGAVRDFFSRIDGASLDNQYGPSETHVITAHLLEGDPSSWPDLPSIGTAIDNCATFILDEQMNPVPDGGEGELYLAGRNLAHGYIGRDDLTKLAFVEAPASIDGYATLYKTGDLAAYNHDGSIEFRGRSDHQIKVLGHRVEPGEINNVAARFPGIGQCLTHAFKSDDGVTRLVAYYTVSEGGAVSYDGLRVHLDAHLPDYMVPAFLIELAEIPYTPSGKVDLQALPKPSIENSRYANELVEYKTSTEEGLAKIWGELLGFGQVPRSADFFELGGDSLRAVTLFLKIQQRFGKELPLAVLSHASTLAELAAEIEGKSSAPDLSRFRSLQMIQKGKEGVPPLFLIHGGAGNVLIFSELAKNLGAEQPVYAFQWSGWDGNPGDMTIPEMAKAYKTELLGFYPGGTFRLGGHCIGGFIAIELARQLKAEGIAFDGPLIISDSPNIKSKAYVRRDPAEGSGLMAAFNEMRSELLTRKMTEMDVANLPGNNSGGMKAAIKRSPLYGLARIARTQIRLLKMHRAAERGCKVPMDARSFYCGQMMHWALRKYKCHTYDGDILFFRSGAHGHEMHIGGWWRDTFLGCSEICSGKFNGHILGGGHDEILKRPELAQHVRKTFSS
uniref:amino acid adenylation domain-containing protein n=1 Tax=Pontiella sp. TaxID=2837462 RepID=UPI0035615517